MADIVYIDSEEGLKRVVNNITLYSKLLGKFLNDTYMNDIERLINDGDVEKAKDMVHTLKGITANLSLIELNKQTLEIELQLKDNIIDKDQIKKAMDVHEQTIIEIKKYIEQHG
jgi:HPt (histidine-containing phosphotransfer) domain-containing protein